MESKEKELKKDGVYLSNFVAMGMAFFVLVLAFAVGFFAKGYFGGSGAKGSGTTGPAVTTPTGTTAKKTVTLDQVKDVFSKSVIKFGDTKRKVIFVEASDPSCPFCSIASGKNGKLNMDVEKSNPTQYRFTLVADGGSYVAPVEEMRKLVDEGKASYAMIYRFGHGNGEIAMRALYCAFDAGRFWQAHDLIMSGPGYDLVNNTVRNDKAKIGELVAFLTGAVDSVTPKACLDSGKYDTRIAEDTKLGDGLNLGGTPGFYINDKLFAGAYNYTDMKSTVDSFLK